MRTAAHVVSFFVLAACNSSDTAPTGASKDAGLAETQPPSDGAPDCVALQTALFVALEDGAKCHPSDAATECSGKAVVKDRCGCDTVLSDSYTKLADAQKASQAYLAQCGTPGCAGMICGSTSATAECKNLNDGRGPICIWAN